MHNLIKSFDEITAHWIEVCLSKTFKEVMGAIENFEISKQSEGPLSQRAIVKVKYNDPHRQLPISLFVKIAVTTGTQNVGCKEIYFYNNILPKFVDKANFPYCYSAHCHRICALSQKKAI